MRFNPKIIILSSALILLGVCERYHWGSIVITSAPEGAEVFLDDTSTGKKTNCTIDSVETGEHTIKLALAGYKDYSQTITVEGDKTDSIHIDLIARIGTIHIISTPAGADVYLDTIPTGKKTNCTLDSVTIGTHSVKLSKAGYADYYDEVTVWEGQVSEVSAVLEKTWGSIHIVSIPTEADVYLDGALTNKKTNCILDSVAVGHHTVKLVKTGYTEHSEEVIVEAGKTTEVSVTLVKATGSIQVNSNPTGAAVYLDGASTGKETNCLLSDVPVGSHILKLTKLNYKDWEETVTVEEEETTIVNATLAMATGSIQVNSTPTGAAVYLDDVNTGETTNCLLTDVEVGSRTVKLVKAGYEDWEQEVEVEKGETAEIDAILEKLSPWQTKTPMPTARDGLACGVVENKIYAIGGGSSSITEEYDSSTDTWQAKNSMPTARNYLACAVVNGKIYAMGGQGGARQILSTVEEYDPATDTWQIRAPMPTPRMGLACAAVNGKIYAIGGGSDREAFSTVEEYDPVMNTWQTKASMPTARSYLACAVVNGKIYVVGGGSGMESFSTVEEYDPSTNRWSTKAAMPTARPRLACSVVNGKIYAIGGGFFSPLSEMEEYDPATNRWTRRTSMPTARYGLSCGVGGGKVYAIGGTGERREILNTVEEYDPSLDTVKSQ